MRGFRLTGVVPILAAMISVPAWADPDSAAVGRFACNSVAKESEAVPLPRFILAEAVLTIAGYAPDRLRREEGANLGHYEDVVTAALFEKPPHMDDATFLLAGRIADQLGLDLGERSSGYEEKMGIKLTKSPPADFARRLEWVFQDKDVSIVCLPRKPVVPIEVAAGKPPEVQRFEFIGAPADLGVTGDDRIAAKSAFVQTEQEKSLKDGISNTSTKLTFDGTFGWRPTSRPVFAYANYTVSKVRKKPAKALTGDEREDDDDTDALEIGILSKQNRLWSPWRYDGKIAYIIDNVKGARRAAVDLTFDPGLARADRGICGTGYYKGFGTAKSGFRAKCYIYPRLAYSHVFDAGRAEFDNNSDFTSAGFAAGYKIIPYEGKDGIVSSISYLWMPTIGGKAPDISRWDAELKYRLWVAQSTIGLDFGLTYNRGRELKTYTDEDKLILGFGVIY